MAPQQSKTQKRPFIPRKVWFGALVALILVMVGREIKVDMSVARSSLPDVSGWVVSISSSSDNNDAAAVEFTVAAAVEVNRLVVVPSDMDANINHNARPEVTAPATVKGKSLVRTPDINDNNRPNHIPAQRIETPPKATDLAPRLRVPYGSKEALQFVHGRRKLYELMGLSRRWKMRGIGYLYSHRNMVLKASSVPAEPVEGRNVIIIENVHPNAALSLEMIVIS
jgi:hypothetical protein